jgi:uncharacterized membrane protein YciS (DUF1049 family)
MFPFGQSIVYSLISPLFAIGIVIGVFLLIRGILLWYWKVDEIVELLKEIKNNTSQNSEKHTYHEIPKP